MSLESFSTYYSEEVWWVCAVLWAAVAGLTEWQVGQKLRVAPTPVARARVAVAGLAALSVALLPALAVPTWLDSQDIEPLPASGR